MSSADIQPIQMHGFCEPFFCEGEEGTDTPYYHVVAFCEKINCDLIVAKFEWDGGSPNADYFKEQAYAMAQAFVSGMSYVTKDNGSKD